MFKSLKQIGLKEKEIKIYLAILKLGSISAQNIAIETGVKRTTVYLVLERLKQIGLVGEIIQKNKKIFFAEKPEKLLKIAQIKKKEIEKEEKRIKDILPQLERILKNKTTESKEEIRHFQGIEGTWNIIENILKSRKDLHVIFPGKTYEHLGLSRILSDVTKKRRQIGGTKAYVITDYHAHNKKLYREGDTDFREIRFLPTVKNFDSGMLLYNNKVALISLQKSYSSILIKNETIYLLVKFMFDSLWKELEGKNLPE
ncbi:MAG: helix-turn-helix domain-containing protein [Candidatus Pacebacteria bacterium]|nr:helix-turn-helix domain-containing protein [Candidatus Paceibacterota bacterium]